ncbi:MAG: hydroxymethylbilane synthase [Ginsengibacter sp.]
MQPPVKIGTRDSELAVWQARRVQYLLSQNGTMSELVYIKSEGDLDTITPLYELGVQGIFTRTLDAALLGHRIDLAVHSMKDVPTTLAAGLVQAAVLKRGSSKDIIVYKKNEFGFLEDLKGKAVIATSSIRRTGQWLHRYHNHTIENLRGNINTRLNKLNTHQWNGAIFAAAGLERIGRRPENSMDLDWMLPAPAQGAIMIVCRKDDLVVHDSCNRCNDWESEMCTKIERDFLHALQGGCSTPVSALAIIKGDTVVFKGNICSPDGKAKIDIEKDFSLADHGGAGAIVAKELLQKKGVHEIIELIKDARQRS